MGDIINLRRVRKAQKRREAADVAADSRVKFGQSKMAVDLDARRRALAEHVLDGHRLQTDAPDSEPK